jgi:exodeoxyribonuclease VII large subunit
MNKAISVSELNNQLKSLLETTFCNVYVEGEISNLTYHNSGHIYFSIKDKTSTISCVMFRGNASKLKFRLEVGAKIIISGSITVYTPRGNYQLLCSSIEPSGVGALALAYEQLKTKLQIKGYFNKAHKK